MGQINEKVLDVYPSWYLQAFQGSYINLISKIHDISMTSHDILITFQKIPKSLLKIKSRYISEIRIEWYKNKLGPICLHLIFFLAMIRFQDKLIFQDFS